MPTVADVVEPKAVMPMPAPSRETVSMMRPP